MNAARIAPIDEWLEGNEMRNQLVFFSLTFSLGLASSARAQQTGAAVGRTPGSAARTGLIIVREKPPEPICDSAADRSMNGHDLQALPEMLFERGYSLTCVRRADGKMEALKQLGSMINFSADGTEMAYWIPESGELHVRVIASASDQLVEALPGAKLQALSWSRNGHKLAYAVREAVPEGIRVIDLETGKRSTSSVKYTGGSATLDPEYLLATREDGVHRIWLRDGHDEIVARMPDVARAKYSQTGSLLGMLIDTVNTAVEAPSVNDEVEDCTGGTFSLSVMETGNGRVLHIPFPPGFDSVLDYEISPHDSTIAITFGTASCDYPGDLARVYMVSLPQMELSPVSRADALGIEAHWSPDGKAIVYQEYTGSDSPLMVYDVATGQTHRLTSPGKLGPDHFLGWR